MKRIIRNMKTDLKHCVFQIEGDPEWELVGVRTLGGRRGKYDLYKRGELQYSMEQSVWLRCFLWLLPIVWFFVEEPFTFYKNGVRCGHSERPKMKQRVHALYDFHFEQQVYRIALHSRGVHSLLKNGTQVAVYKRFGYGNYLARCTEEICDQPDIIILFAAFVELHLVMDTACDANPEGSIVLGDKFSEYARWRPDDELDEEPFLDEQGRSNVFLSDKDGVPIKIHHKEKRRFFKKKRNDIDRHS